VPLIVALPRYLGASCQLGGLMQTAQAFSNVQWALSWLIDNFPRSPTGVPRRPCRATPHGVARSRGHDRDARGEHIEVTTGGAIAWCCARSACTRPDRRALVAEAEVRDPARRARADPRQSGSGKSTIMRAIAGVWPWGRARRVAQGLIAFMPQKP